MDAEILLWIQNHHRNDVLTPLMKGITVLGNAGWFWILLCVLFLLKKEYRRTGITGGIALFGSLILNNLILKNAVGRTRPYEMIRGLELLGRKAWDPSFPSGHSAASFAAATVFFLMLPSRFGIPSLILAALISFSRLYIGIHYPTDVLFGVLDGFFLGIFSVWFMDRIQRRRKESENGIEK
ncbi:MAG: phosphatase PAP2 family protein [Lachnospiraceae bacterium]|nr:phosphatase PAP2 family protein [Lachnospiraceae bacterium]